MMWRGGGSTTLASRARRLRPLLAARWLSSSTQSELIRNAASIPPERIRNFCIISHVDHGKSTLADRMIEMSGAIDAGARQVHQMLDSLEVERQRGITIKAQTVSLFYQDAAQGETYLLNLIDTPGHVDFSYEVSRSIAACQGALLLVDATKGVQAQTVANFYLAFEQDLGIVPVVNKVDLGHADIDGTLEQMATAFDIERDEALRISAKTGLGVDALFPAILKRIPPPAACASAPLRLLLFDAWYDDFRGVLCLVEVLDGKLERAMELVSAATGSKYTVQTIELMRPLMPAALPSLGPGHVGCVSLGMKTIHEANVGDTLSQASNPQPALPGFRKPQPMVFAGLFPLDENGFQHLSDSMSRFLLKDGSISVENTHSGTLGRGLRCGFLGMLHMEVVQQRLLEEHDCDVIVTAPTVPLKATMKDGSRRSILSAEDLEQVSGEVKELFEPLVKVTLLSPAVYTGDLIALCESREGVQVEHSYLGSERTLLRYVLPLAEIATEFHDRVKTISSGYASLDYEEAGEQPADVVPLGLKVNGKPVDALTRIVRRNKAVPLGRDMVETLQKEMSRQVYDIVLQAVIGSSVVARETIRALRKNVLAKCYGGDVTRKKKLLEKQKEGKKRRALSVGDVAIPQKALTAVLSPASRK